MCCYLYLDWTLEGFGTNVFMLIILDDEVGLVMRYAITRKTKE